MSFENIILYSKTLLVEDEKETKRDNKGEEVINADDPRNKERVREILFG